MDKKVVLWLTIIRPQTLFASVCPVVIGCLQVDGLDWWRAWATLLCAVSLQVLSNLINDYYDYQRGADKKGRVGFKRALAEGEVSIESMRRACFVALGIAVGLGGYLSYVGGWVIVLIGLSSLLFAWLYTATRHSLSYLGIADLFVFLYYGVIAVWGTVYLQDSAWAMRWEVVMAGAVCGLISMCVLIVNNLRDIDSDRAVGKRTFPVRFGKRAGEWGMAVVVGLMPLAAWWGYGHWLPTLVVVPATVLLVRTLRAEGGAYNRCLLMAGLVNVVYVLLVALI